MKKETKRVITMDPKNKVAKLVEMKCDRCGAPLEMVDETRAKCSFCKAEFKIDEAKGVDVSVYMDAGSKAEISRSTNTIKVVLIMMVVAAILSFIGFFAIQLSALYNGFSFRGFGSRNGGILLHSFCEDVFGKEYLTISKEELSSIKYISYDYQRSDIDANDSFHVVYYSFTDYADCESEEEFQSTIQTWSMEGSNASWPADYTMFKGLTRMKVVSQHLSSLRVSDKAKITYLETDAQISIVSKVVNPKYLKSLYIGEQFDGFEGIEKYENLEELVLEGWGRYNEVDVSGLKDCKKLKTLKLDCADSYVGVETLVALPELKSLSISAPLKDISFFEQMTQLEVIDVKLLEEEDCPADISVFSKMPNLKKLYLDDYEEYNASRLKNFNNLEALGIGVETTDQLRAILSMSGLKELSLHASISEYMDYEELPLDLSGMQSLRELEKFTLTCFSTENITGFEHVLSLPKIESVSVSGGVLGDRICLESEAVQGNESLQQFSISNYQLSECSTQDKADLSFLSKYPNLKEISLISCDLEEITFVTGLTNLRQANFASNQISDFSPLKECHKLEKIYIFANPVTEADLSEEVVVDSETVFF